MKEKDDVMDEDDDVMDEDEERVITVTQLRGVVAQSAADTWEQIRDMVRDAERAGVSFRDFKKGFYLCCELTLSDLSVEIDKWRGPGPHPKSPAAVKTSILNISCDDEEEPS